MDRRASSCGQLSIRPSAYLRFIPVLSPALIAALSAPQATLYAGALAGVVALTVAAFNHAREDRARRRQLYSDAYRAALEWCEFIYRIRRRNPDGSQDLDLVARGHDLQERIAFHEGIIATESKTLSLAYRAFLDAVMTQCEPLLRDAWSKPGRLPTDPTPPEDQHPSLNDAKDAFTGAVRRHLAPWYAIEDDSR